jgi:DHA2 family multidrug resistance protein
MLAQMRAGFMASGADPVTATNRAYGALFGAVWRQASMVSFVTIFQILGALFIGLIPLVLIMKRPSRQDGQAPIVE